MTKENDRGRSRAPSFRGDPPAAAEGEVLPDRRELALVAVERTRMPMVISDPRQPDNPIVLANDAFLKLTGYSASEVIGRNCRFLQGPGTDPAHLDALRRGLANDEDHIQVELLNYRKDGSSFWNQLGISAVYDDSGKLIYYFASQIDITALRRTQELERTERLLLMEVDHRSNNALALVQSIVKLSSADSVQGFSAAVRRRVDSLARAHRLLAENGWKGVDFNQVVALEAPPALEANGPSTLLPPSLVQPMTLVMHELVTNARQHGGLSDPDGKVALRWEVTEENLVLQWHEYMTRPPVLTPQPGLGLKLIAGVLERQLSGRMALQWPDDGLKAELSIPYLVGTGDQNGSPSFRHRDSAS